MKLLIACIGRAARGPERDLYDHYANRIRWPLALRELEEKKKLPPAQLMAREGELLLQAAPAGATLVALDRRGKVLDSQAFADYMVIASGRSNRQVVAIAEHLADRLKQAGHGYIPVEGKQTGDWVLADAGDVVVHIFRPEPRAFYALEKMWALENEVAVKPKAVRARRAKKPA